MVQQLAEALSHVAAVEVPKMHITPKQFRSREGQDPAAALPGEMCSLQPNAYAWVARTYAIDI